MNPVHTSPAVAAYADVVTRIETLVLARCPALLRPHPMPARDLLALAEALADAARIAAREDTP